jgi:outer membrane protein assembly factor BamB
MRRAPASVLAIAAGAPASKVGHVASGRRRRQRLVGLLALALGVLMLTGCSGHTTGASNVTTTSAQLNFVGSCGSGERCSYYVQYRKSGTSTWSQTPTRGPIPGPVTNASLSETATGLTDGTGYEYQACGNAQTTQAFSCVGPDGTPSTKSTFATTPAMSLTPSPNSGAPGTQVSLTGSGFTAHEAVDVYFDLTDESLVSADGSGGISATLTLPASAQPGNHWLTAVGRSSSRSAQTAFTVQTDWAQFHFGASHTGINPYENTISASNVSGLNEAFIDQTSNVYGAGTPVVAGGNVYVASPRGLYVFPASCGSASCSALWTAYLGDLAPTPAVAGGTVYVNAGGTGGPGYVDAFSASCGTGGATCSPLWSGQVGSNSVPGPPVVSGSAVYVGSDTGASPDTGQLSAFPASCGTGGASCSPLWTASTSGPIDATPTVAGGVVYVGDDSGTLYAFPTSCGTGGASCSPLWTASLGAPVHASPAVSNGLVYVGAGGNVWAFPTSCGTGGGTCSDRWFYGSGAGGAPFDSSPAVANGVVYVGRRSPAGASGTLVALSAATGSLDWTGTTASSIGTSSPAVANGVVYIGDEAGDLYAFPASCGTGGATCSPLWTATAGDDIEASPAVANGTIYVGSNDGLHAYDLNPAHAAAAQLSKPHAATLKPNYSLRRTRSRRARSGAH